MRLRFTGNYAEMTNEAYSHGSDFVDMYNDEGYGELSEALWEYLDNAYIYYDDQWELMKQYQTPDNANFCDAFMELYNDILENIEVIEDEEAEDE